MHDPITPPPQITTRMYFSAFLLFETGSSDVASLYISEASRLNLIVIKSSWWICVAAALRCLGNRSLEWKRRVQVQKNAAEQPVTTRKRL